VGEIIEKRRRYYSGLNADKVTIPAGGKAVGDRYYATDTLVEFTWTGAAWVPLGDDTVDAGMLKTDAVETLKIKALNVTKAKVELGFGRFVPLFPAGADFDEDDFTHDSAWHVNGLDCTGLVPAGTIAIIFSFEVKSTGAGESFFFRHTAGAQYTHCGPSTQVANLFTSRVTAPMPCESDRLVDYYSTLAGVNGATRFVRVAVVGYFI